MCACVVVTYIYIGFLSSIYNCGFKLFADLDVGFAKFITMYMCV